MLWGLTYRDILVIRYVISLVERLASFPNHDFWLKVWVFQLRVWLPNLASKSSI